MPVINYLSELDKINAKKALGPIIQEMTERQLKVALLYVLHGIDIYEAVDSATGFPREASDRAPFGPLRGLMQEGGS